MPLDQIEQREQEDPDDVDEVPVEAEDFDRRVPLLVGGTGFYLRALRRPMISFWRHFATNWETFISGSSPRTEAFERNWQNESLLLREQF